MAEQSGGASLAFLDLALGVTVAGSTRLARTVAAASRVLVPTASLSAELARLLTTELRRGVPGRLVAEGQAARAAAASGGKDLLGSAIRRLFDAVLDRLDLTELVERRVDLDRLAGRLDIDAIIDRLDLTELVERRVDLDRLAGRLDIDAIIDRLDLTELVERRVDLDRLAGRLDIDAIIDRLDLDAIAARLDVDRIVDRLDLIELAHEVVEGIDLPRIIRESTGSVASEGISSVRIRSMEADRAVTHFVDRVLFRRTRPVGPEPSADGSGPPGPVPHWDGDSPVDGGRP